MKKASKQEKIGENSREIQMKIALSIFFSLLFSIQISLQSLTIIEKRIFFYSLFPRRRKFVVGKFYLAFSRDLAITNYKHEQSKKMKNKSRDLNFFYCYIGKLREFSKRFSFEQKSYL